MLNTGLGPVLHLHPQSAAALPTGEQTTKAQSASEQGLFWGLGCLLWDACRTNFLPCPAKDTGSVLSPRFQSKEHIHPWGQRYHRVYGNPSGMDPSTVLRSTARVGQSELMQPYTASEVIYEQYRGPIKVQSACMYCLFQKSSERKTTTCL